MKTRLPIILIITAIAASLWLPNLGTYGMFMDGVINASVAKLYAEGTGSFFHLQEQYYANGSYVGHPPLAFALQAGFFKVFGTAFYLDKVYSVLCALLQLLLIKWLWNTIVPNEKLKRMSWLACLLWVLSPIISWGYSSNLLENTMTLFTTLALIAIATYTSKGKYLVGLAFAAALFTFGAILCKGPVGLFVLAAPLVLIGTSEHYTLRKALLFMMAYGGMLAAMALGLWLLPNGQALVKAYLSEQLKPSMSIADGNTLAKRLVLLPNLLKALIPMLAIVVLALIAPKKLAKGITNTQTKLALRYILLGLCGTLPILLSNKQSAFYVIPAMPVFAIGFALLSVDVVAAITERIFTRKVLLGIGGLSVIAIIAFAVMGIQNYGTYLRDQDKLTDAAELHSFIDNAAKVSDPQHHFIDEYHFKAYLSRLYGIAVYPNQSQPWVITKEPLPNQTPTYQGQWLLLYRNQ